MKEKLSEKQKLILEYIKKQSKLTGYPPTVREICNAVGLSSTSTVHAHIRTLQNKGYLYKEKLKTRALKVVNNDYTENNDEDCIFVPVLGRVTAGEPILALQNIEGSFPLPSNYKNKGNLFMLKVKGESMINVGILDGDYIIVSSQPTAENGEKVVALINDEATVKTFYKHDSYFRLQPENDSMEPIILKEVRILGKVIGLYRDFH